VGATAAALPKAVRAWVARTPFVRRAAVDVHIEVDATVCAAVSGGPCAWCELFSGRATTCDDVVRAVREALDAWLWNAPADPSASQSSSQLSVRVVSEQVPAPVLARTNTTIVASTVVLNRRVGWQLTPPMCQLWEHPVAALAVGCVFCISLILVAAYAKRTPVDAPDHRIRGAAALLVAFLPGLSVSVVLPCHACYALSPVLVHEFGHALGFAHSDVPIPASGRSARWCGCGAEARACSRTAGGAGASVMRSWYENDLPCLSTDDISGFRTLWGNGTACGAPERCPVDGLRGVFELARRAGTSLAAALLLLATGRAVSRQWQERRGTAREDGDDDSLRV